MLRHAASRLGAGALAALSEATCAASSSLAGAAVPSASWSSLASIAGPLRAALARTEGCSVPSWDALLTTQRRGAHAAASPSDVEDDGLPRVVAALRTDTGTTAANATRAAGLVPGLLDSIDGKVEGQAVLQLSRRQVESLMRSFNRRGIYARPMELLMLPDADAVRTFDPTAGTLPTNVLQRYRVIPRMVHIDPAKDFVENIVFLHAPADRVIKVDVPVKVEGEGTNVVISRGGYVLNLRWTVKVRCPAGIVPPTVSVNVSDMELNDVYHLRDVPLPEGVALAEKDPNQPVLKIGGRRQR